MSSAEDSSDPEWKTSKIKLEKNTKHEHNSSSGSRPKYSQKFCEKWMKIFHPWLARCDDDHNKPFCRACQCRLDCNRCHLQRHERTTKHARNLEILINKGESAARQNLSIRRERSKYYQQRKENTSYNSSQEFSDNELENDEGYIVDGEIEEATSFQFVQSEAITGDDYTEESILKQETMDTIEHADTISQAQSQNERPIGVTRERLKLFMQIQKDKNDLMDSFKELIQSNMPNTPPREKNHVDLFFDSVSSSVKALSPKLIAEAKMRVSQLVCELELRAITENDANAASGSVVVTPDVGNSYILNQSVGSILHEDDHHHVGATYEALN